MASKYKPFRAKKQLLICALYDAIDWEQSRLDANICQGEELVKTKGRMAAYNKLLLEMCGGAKTRRQNMNEMLNSMKTISLTELFNDPEFRSSILKEQQS